MFTKSNDTLRQILVISGLAMVLVVNGLANLLPINGLTTGQVADNFTVYFVPANYVFSIWGLIYFFQLAYIVYQALPSQKENPIHRSIAPWYLLISVANASWIFLWHYEQFAWSIVAMLALLVGLIRIYLRVAGRGRSAANRTETWVLRAPFSLYLAWITVATVANVTSWLDFIGWSGLGISEMAWGVIMLLVATVIEGFMIVRYRDLAYLGVIIWAFIGIAVRQAEALPVAITAVLMTAAVVAAYFVARRQNPSPTFT